MMAERLAFLFVYDGTTQLIFISINFRGTYYGANSDRLQPAKFNFSRYSGVEFRLHGILNCIAMMKGRRLNR